jgi:hypothetical protein
VVVGGTKRAVFGALLMSGVRRPELLHLDLGQNRDPDLLRNVVSAHLLYERMRTYRRFFVGVLAALGAAFWLAAVWPRSISKETRSLGIEVFALCLITTVIVGALEFKWHRRRARLIRDSHGPSSSDA